MTVMFSCLQCELAGYLHVFLDKTKQKAKQTEIKMNILAVWRITKSALI